MEKHYLIFIHGIGDGGISTDYDTLFNNIGESYKAIHKLNANGFSSTFYMLPVRWDEATETPERNLYQRCFGTLRPKDKSLVSGNGLSTIANLSNTKAWRYFMSFFVADAVAYVDKTDNGIRRDVWRDINSEFQLKPGEEKEVPSFTVVGHSLGSVIAYDFVHALMKLDKIFKFGDPVKDINESNPKLTKGQIEKLKKAFNGLVTFGSPVALFMMRRRDLYENSFAALRSPVGGNGDNRKWLNFWDSDDLIAYPLEDLFGQHKGSLTDLQVETGLIMPWAHTGYWKNKDMAGEIAKILPPPSAFAKNPTATASTSANT